jgi:hypothetical protein
MQEPKEIDNGGSFDLYFDEPWDRSSDSESKCPSEGFDLPEVVEKFDPFLR